MAKATNARKKKLEAIQTKIATFMFQDTFTDEGDAQKLLGEAIRLIDQAADILVANDEKQAGSDAMDGGGG